MRRIHLFIITILTLLVIGLAGGVVHSHYAQKKAVKQAFKYGVQFGFNAGAQVGYKKGLEQCTKSRSRAIGSELASKTNSKRR